MCARVAQWIEQRFPKPRLRRFDSCQGNHFDVVSFRKVAHERHFPMKKGLFLLVLLAVIGGGVWWFMNRSKPAQVSVAYKTAPITRGQAVQTIRATGTIEPEDLIDIGAQVTGQIMAFGTDTNGKEVDYCSEVRKGQLLARIDDVTYKAEVTISKANLTTAKAQLAGAQADVAQLNARLRQAEREWKRAQQLGVGDAVSQKDYDAYLSAYEVALANLKVGEAKIEQSEAAIAQAQAQLEKAERNLSYCDILSTVDGIIIDRRVNIGQTVTASMSTPSLFLVAKDLSRIEIWVPVNEADIGEIKIGQRVRFTVDAFPEREFEGAVARIRLNASMSSNVVTYTVEVATENPDSILLPYLTANVRFVLAESPKNSLLAPAAALRWRPEGWVPPAGSEGKQFVFVQNEQGTPEPVAVEVGVQDDVASAIVTDQLDEGDVLITGILTQFEVFQATAAGQNPFMPKPPRFAPRR